MLECMICFTPSSNLNGIWYRCTFWGAKFGCNNIMCQSCICRMKNVKSISFPVHYKSQTFRCSQMCLINATIDSLNDIYIDHLEKDFVFQQNQILTSIKAIPIISNFLYKDLVNIINEYIICQNV